ncbi:hypothetical protein Tco_0707166 [Tanacetum coccineum]|uniref:Reverse transcriptase Ty1/copia-type domain-containing protein n=1 Tax=Tanacetum coccineum TaxID=301880 RepID=A0ABQ4Y9J2_9ASTR
MGAKDCCLMGLREEMGGASSKELPRALFIGGDMEIYGCRIGVVEVIWGVVVVAADWSKKGGMWLHLRPRKGYSSCISYLGGLSKMKLVLNNENVEQTRFSDDSSSKDVNAVGQQVNTVSPDVNTGSPKLIAFGSISLVLARQMKQDSTEKNQSGRNARKNFSEIQTSTSLGYWWNLPNRKQQAIGTQNGLFRNKERLKWETLFLTIPDIVYKVVKALFMGLPASTKRMMIFSLALTTRSYAMGTFNTSDVDVASTPVDLEKPLVKDGDADDVDVHLYRSMIGSLMYLTASRLDIMFAVCACARFQVTPKTSHLLAVKMTMLEQLLIGSLQLGDVSFLGNMLISWQCKNQTVVATYTTKAEYVVAASCCGQVLWIQPDLDTLSMDDLYNNLKIYETEVKGSSISNQNSQNVAFVSSNNSGSSNHAYGSNSVNTCHTPPRRKHEA